MRRTTARSVTVLAAAAMAGTALAACGGGDSGSGGTTEITFLTQASPQVAATGKALVEGFNKANPGITVKLETQPDGTEGDNLTKTKLSTGDMAEVFSYNTGSLMQALNPDNQLLNLSGEPWAGQVNDDFKSVVSTDNGMYGAPIGMSFGGGILYNKDVYQQLGLEIPTSWDEFMANSQKIKAQAPDIAPVLQSYGDTWTSQIFVLADFANVAKVDPGWAEGYTAGQKKYAQEPAVAGFEHLEEVAEAGLLNKDFASMTSSQALKSLTDGTGAQYPLLTNAIPAIAQDFPEKLDTIGYFALPAEDAANTSATIWQPNALYIPKSAEGDELEAAKKFVEYATSTPEGCQIQADTGVPSGPPVTTACELGDDVPTAVKDLQTYFDEGATVPALEFLSPVKGPGLESIAVEVGSGISDASTGAARYDEDVKKQAQQLGLEGW